MTVFREFKGSAAPPLLSGVVRLPEGVGDGYKAPQQSGAVFPGVPQVKYQSASEANRGIG